MRLDPIPRHWGQFTGSRRMRPHLRHCTAPLSSWRYSYKCNRGRTTSGIETRWPIKPPITQWMPVHHGNTPCLSTIATPAFLAILQMTSSTGCSDTKSRPLDTIRRQSFLMRQHFSHEDLSTLPTSAEPASRHSAAGRRSLLHMYLTDEVLGQYRGERYLCSSNVTKYTEHPILRMQLLTPQHNACPR